MAARVGSRRMAARIRVRSWRACSREGGAVGGGASVWAEVDVGRKGVRRVERVVRRKVRRVGVERDILGGRGDMVLGVEAVVERGVGWMKADIFCGGVVFSWRLWWSGGWES